MIEIAENIFPYDINFDNYSYKKEDLFENNEDYKISFKKRLKSKNNKTVNVNFDICKDKFSEFYLYLILDTDSTKKMFYINIEIDGKYEKKLVDMISYPYIKFINKTHFNISFNLIIIDNI